MRVMCRCGFEMDLAALFIRDFKAGIEFFKSHPSPKITPSMGTGFHHT